MGSFKPKRISGAELARQIATVTADLPSQQPPSSPAPTAMAVDSAPARTRPPPTVQINFKASEALAATIAAAAADAGSTRRFFARLMREAGYAVPEADITPPDTRRRWTETA